MKVKIIILFIVFLCSCTANRTYENNTNQPQTSKHFTKFGITYTNGWDVRFTFSVDSNKNKFPNRRNIFETANL